MSHKIIPTPRFTDIEMRRCMCCTPSQPTLITLDPQGREQFQCPKTHLIMRWSDGAQTYIQGTSGFDPMMGVTPPWALPAKKILVP